MEQPGLSLRHREKMLRASLALDLTMQKLKEKVVDGASVRELCILGDKLVMEYITKLASIKNKGISFPTAISLNNCAGYYSPRVESDGDQTIRRGDLVKIELGAQVGGYCSSLSDTVVAGGRDANERAAELLTASLLISEIAVRLFVPGANTRNISKKFVKACKELGVSYLSETYSHNMVKGYPEGDRRVVMGDPKSIMGIQDLILQPGEAFAIDVILATGERGLPYSVAPDGDLTSTIYSVIPGRKWELRSRIATRVVSVAKKTFGPYPFTASQLTSLDPRDVRFGLNHCVNNGVVSPYTVEVGRKGDLIANVKVQVLLGEEDGEMPTKITGTYYRGKWWKEDETAQRLMENLSEEFLSLLDKEVPVEITKKKIET